MAYHPQSSGKIKHKIIIKKTMLGDPPTMGSITAHSLALANRWISPLLKFFLGIHPR
jgi:hypothetical protein